jgi:hypothetical protein
MIMKQIKIAVISAAMLLGAISCQKEETEIKMTNIEAEQEVIAENLLAEIDALTDEAVDIQLDWLKSGSATENYLVDDCPVVTYDKTSTPRKIVLDYGTGCIGRDDKTRSGKIIITSTAFENLSVKREKTFDNFYVEGKKIEGKISKTVTFSREDRTRVAVVEEEITVTFEDNTSLIRKANLTREHFLGIPAVRMDDETKTWGEVITKHASGVTITKTIDETTPLLFKAACRQIVRGIATFANGEINWTIDYGTGECDNTATITRDGETRTVKIRK